MKSISSFFRAIIFFTFFSTTSNVLQATMEPGERPVSRREFKRFVEESNQRSRESNQKIKELEKMLITLGGVVSNLQREKDELLEKIKIMKEGDLVFRNKIKEDVLTINELRQEVKRLKSQKLNSGNSDSGITVKEIFAGILVAVVVIGGVVYIIGTKGKGIKDIEKMARKANKIFD